MDVLTQIIATLTSDEVRRFKILSNRFKADEEKKLLLLFDAFRSGGIETREDDVVTELYGNLSPNSKNNYYRLKNKLFNSVEKSLLFYHYNDKSALEPHSYLQLSLIFEERGLYRETYHYLKKAEKVAIKNDQFNVLEVIYDEMVRLASKDIEVEIENILQRRKENFEKLQVTRMTSEVLGVISQQLKKRNFSDAGKKSESVIKLLEETREKLESHQRIFHSSSGKILIFRAVAAILQQKSAYAELEKYVKETFTEFKNAQIFNKENHSFRILMQIWRINSLGLLLRLEEAREGLNELKADLEMYNRRHFNEYAIYYYSAKINNDKSSGNLQESMALVQEALSIKEVTQSNVHELLMLISLADQYFCQEQPQSSLETLEKIRNHPRYLKLGEEIRFYLSVFEIVLCYETRSYAAAEQIYLKWKKDFKSLMKDGTYDKAARFAEIMMRLIEAAKEGKRIFLKSALKSFEQDFPPSKVSSNQVIMYEIYLQSLLEGNTYYPAFCEYVKLNAKSK